MARKSAPQSRETQAPRVVLEVCVESVADAGAAAAGGADRLELNSALALDGLTPSIGLLTEVRRAVGRELPVITMARPRAGNFVYDDSEFRVMLRDVELLLENRADGVAFGILDRRGGVDVARCRRVMKLVTRHGAVGVFHRAFDRVRRPLDSLEQLIQLGFRRVMTSGQQPTALLGAELIDKLVQRASGRIDVLPAGGIRPSNAAKILARTRCTQLHTSLREPGRDGMSRKLLRQLVRVART